MGMASNGGSHDLLLTARKYFAHALELKPEGCLRALYGILLVCAAMGGSTKGKGTKETRSIVTAIWDWAPVASWDNGAHWPSWQTAQDGASGWNHKVRPQLYAAERSLQRLNDHIVRVFLGAFAGYTNFMAGRVNGRSV